MGLLVNDYWLELLKNDYITEMWVDYNSGKRQTGLCNVCIKESWDAKWHAGSSLLLGYYTGFDYTTKQLTVVPNAASAKSTIEQGAKPSRILGNNPVTITLLSLGIATSVGGMVWLVIIAFCVLAALKALLAKAGTAKQGAEGTLARPPNTEQIRMADLLVLIDAEQVQVHLA